MEIIIVTQHDGAVAWLESQGIVGPRLKHATEDDVAGRLVVGNVPLRLAERALGVLAIEFEGQPPRGAEYTVADMVKAGARLRFYAVSSTRVLAHIAQGCEMGEEEDEVPAALREYLEGYSFPPSDCSGGEAGLRRRKPAPTPTPTPLSDKGCRFPSRCRGCVGTCEF